MRNEELIDEFLGELKAFGKRENTINSYRKSLNGFNRAIASKPFAQVNRSDIISYINSTKYVKSRCNGDLLRDKNGGHIERKNSTRKLEFQHLDRFYEWLKDEKKIVQDNPITRAKRQLPPADEREMVIPSPESISKMISLIFDSMDRAMVVLLYKTGARLSEVRLANIEDLNLKNKTLYVPALRSKNRKEKHLLFDDEAKILLERYLEVRSRMRIKEGDKNAIFISQMGSRISDAQMRLTIEAYAKRAMQTFSDQSFKGFTPHTLRHALTTHLVRARILLPALQILRGDKPREIIDKYTHLTPEEVRAEYEKCIPKLGIR